MRENLDGIAVFVEAAEARSFARAADQLALTRSAVGKTIARLEARLGVRLFHRTTRSQSLTDEGQIYYERCLRALAELREGAALLETGRHEVIGRLKVSAPNLFGRYCVEPVLLDFARQHPKLELDLRFTDQVVDIVNEGYDLAIRNHTPGASIALESRLIARQRKIVCASKEYLETHGTPHNLEDIRQHEALVFWHRGGIWPWSFLDGKGNTIEPELKWRLQFNSHEAIAEATARGMGLAFLPAWLVRDPLEAGTLVPVLEEVPSMPLETFLIWPHAQHYPLKLRLAVEALTEKLKWAGEI